MLASGGVAEEQGAHTKKPLVEKRQKDWRCECHAKQKSSRCCQRAAGGKSVAHASPDWNLGVHTDIHVFATAWSEICDTIACKKFIETSKI